MNQSNRPRKIHVVGAIVLAGAALGVGTAFAVGSDSKDTPSRVEAVQYTHKLNDTSEKTRMLAARSAAGRSAGATELYAAAEVERLRAAVTPRVAKVNDSAEKTRMLDARNGRRGHVQGATELYAAAEIERLRGAVNPVCASAADLMRAADGARVLEAQRPDVFAQTPRPADATDLRIAAAWAGLACGH
jgi:hypothetical protein